MARSVNSFCFVFQMIKGKVRAGKVDCQAYPQTCQKAGIKAYPSVKLYQYERAKVCAGSDSAFLQQAKPRALYGRKSFSTFQFLPSSFKNIFYWDIFFSGVPRYSKRFSGLCGFSCLIDFVLHEYKKIQPNICYIWVIQFKVIIFYAVLYFLLFNIVIVF